MNEEQEHLKKEQEHFKKQLNQYQRNLQRLQEQRAKYGVRVPTDLLSEIEETEAKIRELQAKLPPPDLPLDSIPDPTPALPLNSRMPFSRNPLFVGREADLKTLAEALKGGQTTAIGQIAAATLVPSTHTGKASVARRAKSPMMSNPIARASKGCQLSEGGILPRQPGTARRSD